MKNSLLFNSCLILILFIFSGVIRAQVAKGTFRLGPSIDFSSVTEDSDAFAEKREATQLSLGASLGYYIIDNLEIGLGLIVTNSKSESGFSEITSSGIFVGPQIEYKIGLSPQFYIPIRGGFGYNSLHVESNGAETTFTGISYGVYAGIEFVVNNKLGAALIIGPEFGTLKSDDLNVEYDIRTISSTIGVNFYF